jgi:hypothetical protein
MSFGGHSTIEPTSYADLNIVLRDLVTRVRDVRGDNFIGAYLQGSFAIGDFDIYSDVDVIILVVEDIPDDQLPTLQAVRRYLQVGLYMGAASRRVLYPEGCAHAASPAATSVPVFGSW